MSPARLRQGLQPTWLYLHRLHPRCKDAFSGIGRRPSLGLVEGLGLAFGLAAAVALPLAFDFAAGGGSGATWAGAPPAP